MKKSIIILCSVFALSLGAIGCSNESATTTADGQPGVKPAQPATGNGNATVEAGEVNAGPVLAKLDVAEEQRDGYEREAFDHWADLDGNGCDARDDVLYRENLSPGSDCSDLSGTWYSIYDNATTSDAGSFDVDHFVPLAEAWDSGANVWTDDQRRDYANDLSQLTLIAVSASSNRSKSDQDPADWMPENSDYTCEYAARWVLVKNYWKLSVDPTEKQALDNIFASCRPAALIINLENAKRNQTGNNSDSASAPGETSAAKQPPAKTPPPAAKPSRSGKLDKRFSSCAKASAAGLGPYKRKADREYAWYTDGDGDGIACE